MRSNITPLLTWHVKFDNPDVVGWSVVAAYLLAGICCIRAALKGDEESKVWWLMAGVLIFLGINKQLNLQTLMIVLGRRAAVSGGWYERRRFVQAIFCVVFALCGFAFFWLFAARARRFIVRNRLAFAGIIVLLLFVVLRASTINHANEWFGVDLKDVHWAWLLELCGSALIIRSALSSMPAREQL
jgi:hypothetical protein